MSENEELYGKVFGISKGCKEGAFPKLIRHRSVLRYLALKDGCNVMKLKIMQQVVQHNGYGGPSKALQRLMKSEEMQQFDLFILEQTTTSKKHVIKVIRKYIKDIKKVKPDLIHVRGVQSDGLLCLIAAKFARVPHVVMSVNGMASDLHQVSKIKHLIAEYVVEPLSFFLSERAFTVYRGCLKRKKIMRFGKKVWGWIYNPLPDWDCSEKACIKSSLRAAYGVSETDILALCVSRITYEKGFSYVVEAIKKARENWPTHLKIMIVGKGSYEEILRDELKWEIERNRVIVVPATTEIQQYYFAADVFFTASLHENHSNAILEACAAHLPVIATDVGGNAESIENRKGGWILQPQNIDALVEAFNLVGNMSHNQLEQHGEMAYSYGNQKFNMHVVYKKLADFYLDVASSNK